MPREPCCVPTSTCRLRPNTSGRSTYAGSSTPCYKLGTGCQWRLLAKCFPPRSTVHYYFRQLKKQGVLIRLNDLLHRQVRTEVEGQGHSEATAGVIDTQSVQSTEAGGPERGFDGGVGQGRQPAP